MAARRIAILGATGSIGMQALDVIASQHESGLDEQLDVVALSAGTSAGQLATAAASYGVSHVMLADPASRDAWIGAPDGPEMHRSVASLLDASQPDLVLNAVVGAAGLEATLATLERGIDVALANKESLVVAGSLCMSVAARSGANIIPVDSEHSALQQCIGSSTPAEIDSLVLTASGGPFFGMTQSELASVTVDQALAHPTWSMGGKITIDSATLMNKGLEVIEACVLFGMHPDRVETVVHRDSIVHAMVRHRDGSLLAHLGWPDMRVPIAWALHWPQRPRLTQVRTLDLVDMPSLEFHHPDLATFRCLALARDAADAGNGAPCVLNAANEVAVAAFLAGDAAFTRIADVVEETLHVIGSPGEPESFDHAREHDVRAREVATRSLHALA